MTILQPQDVEQEDDILEIMKDTKRIMEEMKQVMIEMNEIRRRFS